MTETKPQSIFNNPLREAEEARLDAEDDFSGGPVITNERLREWLVKLANGETVLPPEV